MFKRRYLIFLIILIFLSGQAYSQTGSESVSYRQGRYYMADEDWYKAIESFMECVRLNPAHAEANAALAECYYELNEFDEALVWVRKARAFARTNMSILNLEAFTLIALGRLDDASAIIQDILKREPYNREALFAAGELDIARGRTSDALLRYHEAFRRYPDDRRLLISLALVSGSLGDNETALSYINRALQQHPDDYLVFYYAACIYSQTEYITSAIRYAEQALNLKPSHENSRTLLANLRYRNSEFDKASRLADAAIAVNRMNMDAWYLKGLSLIRLDRSSDAISVLSNALAVSPNDEFIRSILEETLINTTRLEDPRRERAASWHFSKAKDFYSRYLYEQALFEYRRGLRLNPSSAERREYAEVLRLSGYPARYLEELIFLQDQGRSDQSVNDAVEAYSSLLSNALFKQWQVNPVDLAERHWKIAVFSMAGQSSFRHADAGYVAASNIREILVHDRNITPMNTQLRQLTFSQGFRQAREEGADYFMLVSVNENERDVSVKAELFTGRTGSPAGVFYSYRTGIDRLRAASKNIADQLSSALPLRGRLLIRKQGQALINKGKADGVKAGDIYDIIKNDKLQIANEGISLVYSSSELVGKITIENVGEEIASGSVSRNGFFDRIEPNDEVILRMENQKPSGDTASNPELRTLLRTLRSER
ncbi:MAG: tetratricopeptide repeat protein [Treponema sp.]|jgi:tetratricopeptide (TPR) repeat protein|nr:tetratricopeptide repeat protein [Treponema sp.]